MMSSEKIDEFCQVTGSDEQIAIRFLSACNDNLEMAVSLFMDSPNANGSRTGVSDLDGNYRSPIPQRTEQLLPVEIPVYGPRFTRSSITTTGAHGGTPHGTGRIRVSRRRPVFLVDDSDDEDDENGWHEPENRGTGATSEPGISQSTSGQSEYRTASLNGSHASASEQEASCSLWNDGDVRIQPTTTTTTGPSSSYSPPIAPPAKRRRENLRQLYRPPNELLFDGNMTQAMASAREKAQWLLVSLHDEGCFDCHILNRDVWKDSKVFMLIRQSFTFVQIPIDSSDGIRYRSRYPYVASATHMAVLNPLTGEQKMMWMHLKDPSSVYDVLSEFLTHNRLTSTSEDCPSTSTRRPPQDACPELAAKRPRKDQLDSVGGISVGVAAVSLVGDSHSSASASSLLSRAMVPCDSQPQVVQGPAAAGVSPLDLSEEEQLRLAIEVSKTEVNWDAADATSTVTISDEDENDSSGVDDDLIVLTDDDSIDRVVEQGKPVGPLLPASNRFPVAAVTSTTAFVSGRRPLWLKDDGTAATISSNSGGGGGTLRYVEPLPSAPPGEQAIELAVRLPDGTREVHSLSTGLPLRVLLGHFASRGLSARNYEMIRLYPRVVLSQLPGITTLGELGLARKDAILIQPK